MQVNSYLFQSPYPQSVQVGRPDPVEEQKQAAEEEAAKSKQVEAEKQSARSNEETASIGIKSATMYQNDSSSKETAKAVEAFIDVAKDVRRLENINTYGSSEKPT